MAETCPICGGPAAARPVKARGGKDLTLWHCAACDFDFLAHDPTRDLAANKLDDSRLKAAGLDIPTRERDFANGLAQSRPYVAEYLHAADRGRNVLEIGCSWGYFLKLAADAGTNPHGVELNTVRARHVNDELGIPCDTDLETCEGRGIRFRKIFLFYVLEYVPAPVAYLQRLIDMLEPEGELIVVTPSLSDALKDVWRNEAFHKFFYDEHAVNYLTPSAVERMIARLHKSRYTMLTRQGYSFVNHVSWFLTNAPRTTGVVGGDNFVADIVRQMESDPGEGGRSGPRADLARRLADLIVNFDAQYRRAIEEHRYGNQIRFVITR